MRKFLNSSMLTFGKSYKTAAFSYLSALFNFDYKISIYIIYNGLNLSCSNTFLTYSYYTLSFI